VECGDSPKTLCADNAGPGRDLTPPFGTDYNKKLSLKSSGPLTQAVDVMSVPEHLISTAPVTTHSDGTTTIEEIDSGPQELAPRVVIGEAKRKSRLTRIR
jgi:hypothetical protein